MENFIIEVNKNAGEILNRWFGKVKIEYIKSSDVLDYVTKADLHSNEYIVNAIKEKFPHHGIISEETGCHNESAEYVWIIDPLDGTINFANDVPQFCILICLMKKGIPQLATIYDPVHKEMFFAKKGKGTYLNGKKVHCSSKKEITESFGCLTHSFTNKKIKFLEKIAENLGDKKFKINTMPSGIMAMYLATGRRDWFASVSGGLWDVAAPALICKEAGCKVTNLDGEDWLPKDVTNIVIANKYLYPKIFEIAQVLKK